jgi:hypothetical protein
MLQFELNTAKEHSEIASTFEQISWQILFVKICSKLRACGQVDAEATLLPRERSARRIAAGVDRSTYVHFDRIDSLLVHSRASENPDGERDKAINLLVPAFAGTNGRE